MADPIIEPVRAADKPYTNQEIIAALTRAKVAFQLATLERIIRHG